MKSSENSHHNESIIITTTRMKAIQEKPLIGNLSKRRTILHRQILLRYTISILTYDLEYIMTKSSCKCW